ncbi:Formyl-coenzyme A transferase [compost metagenome]
MVAEIMLTRTSAEWLEALEGADIPVMPMHTIESLMDDPHLQAVGFFEDLEHPSEGRIRSLGVPASWSKTQPEVTRHAPRLGQHSAEVLREAGYAEGEIAAMVERGVTRVE